MRAYQMVVLDRCGQWAEAEAMLRTNTPLPRVGAAPDESRLAPVTSKAELAGAMPRRLWGMTLAQRAALDEARAYQGRGAELASMLNMLAAADWLPRVVWLHGPPGIGKTGFAYALARCCGSRGWPTVILDSRDFRHDAAVLGEAVTARCASARSAAERRPLLLVFDTFEEMADIERDMWDVILPGLDGPVLVMLAGRCRPHGPAPRGVAGVVDDLELPMLSAAESRQLLRHHGVMDDSSIDSIMAFARGNPLFLTVAAGHARAKGRWDVELSHAVARSLVGRLTRETADPSVRGLLEAASLVRTFNQELLAEMTGTDVSCSFAGLCALSVVRVVPHGARLHDLVRESVAADLRWRTPAACQVMRRRAARYLTRMAAFSADPGPYAQELLHLAASSSGRARFYVQSDHANVRVRMGQPDDLAWLNQLCRTGITRFGLPASERARQLNADFHLALPSLAVAFDEHHSVTGFAYNVALNRSTWRAAAQTRSAYLAALPERELAAIKTAPAGSFCALLVTGVTHLPGYDHVSAPLRQFLFASCRARDGLGASQTSYHLLTGGSPELPEIAAAGLTRRATGIRLTDCLVDEWLLSFGDHGIAGWITATAGNFAKADHAVPAGTSLAPREREALTLIAQGFTQAQAATRMGVSPATIDTYIKRIRRKLGPGNKADLTRHAIALGEVDEAGQFPSGPVSSLRP